MFSPCKSAIYGIGLATLALLLPGVTPNPAAAQSANQYWVPAQAYSARIRRARRARLRRRSVRSRNRRARARRSIRRRSRIKTTLLPKRTENGAPVQIVVSLANQKMTVYEGTKPVATSRISSGQKGYETPSGIFSIIHKKRRHYSNIYHGAPMPFMQRLTWSGIALHEGKLPGYPASHGCIRLPRGFAGSLFRFTERRSHVVIAHGNPIPQPIAHPMLFRPSPPPAPTGPINSAGHETADERIQLALNTAPPEDASISDADRVPQLIASKTPPPQIANPLHHLGDTDLDADRRLTRATRSKHPLRILITRRTERQRIGDLQRMLNSLGFDAGAPDGLIGRQTVAAIKAFQTIGERPVTGYPNQALYQDLYRASGHRRLPEAYLHVRQKTRDIYSAPVHLKDAEAPLGTHLYTLAEIDPTTGKAAWNAVTAKARGRLPGRKRRGAARADVKPMTAKDALDRIEIPAHVRTKIEDLLTRSSSMIITDGGHTRETGINTDFIVLTR